MSSIDDLCIAGADSIRNGGFRRDVFLQEVTQYLILNKQHLPQAVISSLAEAFGRENAKNTNANSRERATAARSRLQLYTKDDILRSAQCLTLDYNPATFWDLQGVLQHAGDYSNVVQRLYHGSRSISRQAVILRAFFTTAIHLFTKRVCERLKTPYLSEGVISHCVRLILGPCPDQQEAKIVEANIRSDNSVGAIYKLYADGLEGYGAYFLIHILPVSTIEITFNQKDDVPFAIQQFTKMGLPEVAKGLGLHDLGSTLISYIEKLFPTCDVKSVTRKKGIRSVKQPTKIKNKKIHRNVNIFDPNSSIPPDHDNRSRSHISQLATNEDNHGRNNTNVSNTDSSRLNQFQNSQLASTAYQHLASTSGTTVSNGRTTSKRLRSSRDTINDGHAPTSDITDTNDIRSVQFSEESSPPISTDDTQGEDFAGRATYDEAAASTFSTGSIEIRADIASHEHEYTPVTEQPTHASRGSHGNIILNQQNLWTHQRDPKNASTWAMQPALHSYIANTDAWAAQPPIDSTFIPNTDAWAAQPRIDSTDSLIPNTDEWAVQPRIDSTDPLIPNTDAWAAQSQINSIDSLIPNTDAWAVQSQINSIDSLIPNTDEWAVQPRIDSTFIPNTDAWSIQSVQSYSVDQCYNYPINITS